MIFTYIKLVKMENTMKWNILNTKFHSNQLFNKKKKKHTQKGAVFSLSHFTSNNLQPSVLLFIYRCSMNILVLDSTINH